MKHFLLPLLSLMLVNANSFGTSSNPSKNAPDIIFLNGDIYTGTAARAQAMAVGNGRISPLARTTRFAS